MAEPKLPTNTGSGIRNRGAKQRTEDLSNYVFGKVQPQAIPLEEAVLGALMLDKDALSVVLDILRPPSFYLDAHQLIYSAMLRLFERSQPIDLLTVMEELKKSGDLEATGGPAYLAELTNRVASAANIEFHARIIAQKHIQRELIGTSTKIIRDAFEDTTDVFQLLDEAEQGLFSIAQQNMRRSYESISSLAAKAIRQLEELKNKEHGLTGVPTGFTELDRLTSGWQPSDLIIVAARPAMGKTSFVLSLARNAAVDFSKGIALFSLEMSSLQLAQRLISMEAEISGSKMRNAQLEDYQWQQLHSAIHRIGEAPIFIDDTAGINVFELRAKCRRMKLQHDIQLVIIDYLQLMSGGSDNQRGNREQEVSAISRALKGMAKELNVPVIALSQLSRAVEVRGGSKRPQLSDLRESGCLSGDTLIADASSGEFFTIKELAERPIQTPLSIWAINEAQELAPFDMVKVFYSGQKPVFELVTASGRRIKASANHPFYHSSGWRRLDQLRVDDLIALATFEAADQYNNGSEAAWAPAGHEGISFITQQQYTREETLGLTASLAVSVIWEPVTAIIPLGVEDVYDATVPVAHNFVANGFVVHNSIEQDADIVSFIYRPEYYGIIEDEEGQSLKGVSEIIVAKNRHGAAKTVRLRFTDEFARFSDLDDPNFDDLPSGAIEGPYTGVITRPSRMNEEEDIPF